jgi:hypothetical protein
LKPGTAAFARYEKYMVAATVGGYLDLGGSRADLRYDLLGKGFAALLAETPMDKTSPTAATAAPPTGATTSRRRQRKTGPSPDF